MPNQRKFDDESISFEVPRSVIYLFHPIKGNFWSCFTAGAEMIDEEVLRTVRVFLRLLFFASDVNQHICEALHAVCYT